MRQSVTSIEALIRHPQHDRELIEREDDWRRAHSVALEERRWGCPDVSHAGVVQPRKIPRRISHPREFPVEQRGEPQLFTTRADQNVPWLRVIMKQRHRSPIQRVARPNEEVRDAINIDVYS